jgi:hypothetical protein
LLEHQSMPVIEFVDRIALAVRKDFSVSSLAPPSKVAFWAGFGCTAGTLHTIWVTVVRCFQKLARASGRRFGRVSASTGERPRTIRKTFVRNDHDAYELLAVRWPRR